MAQKINIWMVSTLVLVGLVVGAVAGVVLSRSKSAPVEPAKISQQTPAPAQQPASPVGGFTISKLPQVSEPEFIRGPVDAPLTLIVYTDTECPFCKDFHNVLQQALQEYPKVIRVVYRHFPLVEKHPRALVEAQAVECAGELGGSKAFFAYLDRIFEVTPSNNKLSLDQLPAIAEQVGLDVEDFNSCVASEKYKIKVLQSLGDGRAVGIASTPTFFIVLPGNEVIPVKGAITYPMLKQFIDQFNKEAK